MSRKRPSLPAYLRLPDGLRFAGTAELTDDNRICFRPKQAVSPLPPEGLPVELVVAGLADDADTQLSLEGDIEAASARELRVIPGDDLPDVLVEAMDPESILWLPSANEADKLVQDMRELGRASVLKTMRRFLVELGDQLFDLSTSSRYGISGQHAHYDALNALKRGSDALLAQFTAALDASLDHIEKDGEGQSFVDLEAASARTLNLVALDEMDQKLAVDKLVSNLIDKHRVDLESLTIRSALVADLEPRKARTPFHPAYIVEAFVDAFGEVSHNVDVMQDTLKFFREAFAPSFDALYPALNAVFIEAGIEPQLEQDILDNGSLLNPVQKRIIKSTVRSRTQNESGYDDADDAQNQHQPPREPKTNDASPASEDWRNSRRDEQHDDSEMRNEAASPPRPAKAKNRHDAMYDAVLNALDTNRDSAVPQDPTRDDITPGSAEQKSSAESTSEDTQPGPGSPKDAGDALASTNTADTGAAPAVNTEALLGLLKDLQGTEAPTSSLDDLPPLEELIRNSSGTEAISLERDGANRLSFIDNVFRTLNSNFEVSSDVAPSLARLRVPLARLSLQEPRFFTQPDHPAHQLLDKLSVLASADQSMNRSLQSKVSGIVDQIAQEYTDDSRVFANALGELDALLSQQGRVFERNIERVISGLEGQEKLTKAQRRVESLLQERLDTQNTPRPLAELLDEGWRSSLVQLALREGEDSAPWREETALLDQLVSDMGASERGELADPDLEQMQHRLRALNQRLGQSNPGAVAHEGALKRINDVLTGAMQATRVPYKPALITPSAPDMDRVEQLPRLRRWMQRVHKLEPGARLRYRDKDGRRRHMRLVWVSDDRDRYAFVNERGQKIAELSAVQLARQLSRGAQPPTQVEDMSVLDQSMYETLEQAQKTLGFDRSRDRLTKLINGESLLYQLQRTLRHAQSRGSEHAFVLLDIDNFALVNEVFDDTSGDQVIAEFAKLLAQLNDRRALTARIEQDEFGILFTYRSIDEARSLADKIRRDIAESSLAIEGESVSFTVSMGITPVIGSSENPETILSEARSALALAKAQGRDQVVVYDIDQNSALNYKLEREASRSRLEEAMSTDRLILRAQPIVQSAIDGSENVSHHYEILLAVRDDEGELQSPKDFIMSAERFGYITLVDRWVVREAFSWISHLMDAQKEVPELSINLSGTSITDNDFLDYVLEQISEYGVGTSRLCFEITETGAIDNLPRAADFVRTLKNIGCKFSLDDFGTGLASHKYLKELPVDYVKIDGTFITEINQNSTDFAMAKSINDLAHFLGQKTVAECVENMEIVPALREIGIDYLQGWGIGMPQSLETVMELLDDLET